MNLESDCLGISVLILTKNEEVDIGGCIDSLARCDDIWVLDSFSTDATEAICNSRGVNFVKRVFDGYASQRNYGLELRFRHEWVLILDADERMPIETLLELNAIRARVSDGVSAVRLRRRDYWWGTWLRYSQLSPFFVRFVRRGKCRYEREVNEFLLVDGDIAEANGHFDHFPFSKGLSHWIAKHNAYSSMEAELAVGAGFDLRDVWRSISSRDFNERRTYQKRLFYSFPLRPLIKMVYMLVFRRGLFDGWAGLRYALLQCIYEYFIVLKQKEIAANKLAKLKVD